MKKPNARAICPPFFPYMSGVIRCNQKKSDGIRHNPHAMRNFPDVRVRLANITIRWGMTSVSWAPTFSKNLYIHLQSSLKKDAERPPETLACA